MSCRNLIPVVLTLASLLAVVSGEDNGHCVWYGECHTDKFNHIKNCPYNGEAKPLNITGQRILSKWCPHLVSDMGSGVKTCCSIEQILTLNLYIDLIAPVLAKCPNCSTNLLKHICEYTCSPVQSNFVKVTSISTSNTTNASYVDSIVVYISNRYTVGTYNSCTNITAPNTDNFVFDLMCGDWGARECTPERWFRYMGNADDNFFVNFPITYNVTDTPVDGFVPLDVPVSECSEEFKTSAPANKSHSVISEYDE